MLVGTYVRQAKHVTVAVHGYGADRQAPAAVVLERSERPGEAEVRLACEFDSLAAALRHTEGLVLSRAGLLGAEAEALVGSPVSPWLARRMFSQPEAGRFVHLSARPPAGR
jgi:hypothetical protein